MGGEVIFSAPCLFYMESHECNIPGAHENDLIAPTGVSFAAIPQPEVASLGDQSVVKLQALPPRLHHAMHELGEPSGDDFGHNGPASGRAALAHDRS
jgi:hypothetical protein